MFSSGGRSAGISNAPCFSPYFLHLVVRCTGALLQNKHDTYAMSLNHPFGIQ